MTSSATTTHRGNAASSQPCLWRGHRGLSTRGPCGCTSRLDDRLVQRPGTLHIGYSAVSSSKTQKPLMRLRDVVATAAHYIVHMHYQLSLAAGIIWIGSMPRYCLPTLADPESPFRSLREWHTLQKVSPTSKNSSDFASLCIIERFKTNLPAYKLLRFLYISGNVQIYADFGHCGRGICP